MDIMRTILVLVSCYLLGSVPWGVIVGRKHGVDVLSRGSGSTGATNVYRTVGKKAAALVLVLDVVKGCAGPLIGGRLSALNPDIGAVLGGVAAIAGHCYSPFLGFKGGKGVATSAGAALVILYRFIPIGLAIFAVIAIITRYASLASLTAVTTVVGMVLFSCESFAYKAFALVAAAIIFYRHIPNIKRLMSGRENRIDPA
ncbi:MAG TPA: glycerol-3-phosphate 1-O-acyltransferase PlsY [Firmicutes bacterium]|nr:glycerol-3-phosphate 1-O-acyltransferase PlsY [Bacillota bacterium]